MGKLDQIYARLPVWAQHLAVSAYGVYWHQLRFGPGYARYLNEYLSRENWTEAQWSDWQRKQLGILLKSAVDIPYYADNWSALEKQAALAGQLDALPLLEKESLRQNPRAFLRQDLGTVRELVFHTSGSTGTPVASIWTIEELRRSLALREARSARWAGVSFSRPRATFSGRLVEPDPESCGPFYRYNRAERQVYLSPFHLRPDTAGKYIEALYKHKTEWLTGYAVSFYLLAKFILERQISVPKLNALITTSEKVTPGMREIMEKAFRCKVFEEYSTVENALFASECEFGRLHISPDVAVVEILRPDGSPTAPGEVGEVVTTNLSRSYQIFIRHRLGDLAAWSEEPCPCGRHMPIIKEVIGRIEDVVIGPDGRRMVRFHGIFVNQPHIQMGQVVQEDLTRIRVKVVPSQGFGPEDVEEIILRVHQRLGNKVEVIVEQVATIPLTVAGKYKAVISMLKTQGNEEAEQTGL